MVQLDDCPVIVQFGVVCAIAAAISAIVLGLILLCQWVM